MDKPIASSPNRTQSEESESTGMLSSLFESSLGTQLILLFAVHWVNILKIASISIRVTTEQEYDKHKFMNNSGIECEWQA